MPNLSNKDPAKRYLSWPKAADPPGSWKLKSRGSSGWTPFFGTGTERDHHQNQVWRDSGDGGAAAPTRTDLDDREAENARLRAELIDKTNELHATHKERDELRRDSLGKQDRIDQLIRDNTDLVQEKQALERQLTASQRNAPK